MKSESKMSQELISAAFTKSVVKILHGIQFS